MNSGNSLNVKYRIFNGPLPNVDKNIFYYYELLLNKLYFFVFYFYNKFKF